MEKVFFNNGVGQGLILSSIDNESSYIGKVAVTINGKEIKPGELTDLDGFFNHPIKFSGVFIEHPALLCFFLGEEKDLFNVYRYYDCYYLIDEDRLFKKYKEDSGRDFNFINGQWK
jgi:hypothetical protein